MTLPFLNPCEIGLRLSVKARPATSRDRAVRVVEVADGRHALEIAVSAAPEDGKANKALIAKIAEALGLKKKQVTLISGPKSRLKVFEVEGEAESLSRKITEWIGS